jgi:hypothetical protein
MIKGLYTREITNVQTGGRGTKPSYMGLEFLAALERLLCFCHTGNAAVFATSLMHPLGLSKGVLKDGFPMLLQLFTEPTILSAMNAGFPINASNWPLKGRYPSIASKRAQVLTYSSNHFLVSFFISSLALHYRCKRTTHGKRSQARLALRPERCRTSERVTCAVCL